MMPSHQESSNSYIFLISQLANLLLFFSGVFSIVKTLEKNAQTSPFPKKSSRHCMVHNMPQTLPPDQQRSFQAPLFVGLFVCQWSCCSIPKTKDRATVLTVFQNQKNPVATVGDLFSREGLTIHLKWHSD